MNVKYKKIEAGHYESDTHRIYKHTWTHHYTRRSGTGEYAWSRQETEWRVVDLLNGKVYAGLGTLAEGKRLAERCSRESVT